MISPEQQGMLSINRALSNLVNGDEQLLSLRLVELSKLSPGELKLFEKAWVNVEPQRRRQIIHRLVELAEDNLEFNFDDIFKSRLEDEDAEIRRMSIEGLWENEEPTLIKPLIELLIRDSSESVQAAAATALGKFTLLAEYEKLRPDYASMVNQTLLEVLNDSSKPVDVRRRALEAASHLSLPEVKDAIIKAYRSRNAELKASSVYAMGKSYDRSWLPMVINELSSSKSAMRYEAATASGELEDEEASPHLVELLDDPDIEVQLVAIRALGKIGGSMAKKYLKSCLGSQQEEIRQATAEALQVIKAAEDPLSFPI